MNQLSSLDGKRSVSMTEVQTVALNLAGGCDAVVGRIASAMQTMTARQILPLLAGNTILSSEDVMTHEVLCQLLRRCTRQQLETVLDHVSADAFETVFGRSGISQAELESAGLQSDQEGIEMQIMLIHEALGAVALQNAQETPPAIDPTSPPSSSLDDEPQPSLLEAQPQ